MDSGHDYLKYAGTCKEASEAMVANDDSLRLVRGYYDCPSWGRREHWWTVKQDGTVVDPTVNQFPTCGIGAEYVEFDGYVECEQCGKSGIKEDDAMYHGNFAFCSTVCIMRCVGL